MSRSLPRKKKIALVFGTRPEAIKMAPIVKELEKYSDKIETLVIVTAQHRHMLDQILRIFNIRAHHDLDIMAPNQTLFDIVTVALKRLDRKSVV